MANSNTKFSALQIEKIEDAIKDELNWHGHDEFYRKWFMILIDGEQGLEAEINVEITGEYRRTLGCYDYADREKMNISYDGTATFFKPGTEDAMIEGAIEGRINEIYY